MNQLLSDLRENRPIAVEISVLESFQEQRRCKSMPNMAFKTKSVGDAPETTLSVPSTEMKVLTRIHRPRRIDQQRNNVTCRYKSKRLRDIIGLVNFATGSASRIRRPGVMMSDTEHGNTVNW